jgi:cell division transport system permease protein
MKDFWYDKVEVSVYLCGEASQTRTCGGSAVTDEQRAELQADLEAMPEVQTVYYESQDEAYEQFRRQFEDSPDLVENVTADALPESFRVKLEDPTQFAVVAEAFASRPGVEEVQDQKALLEGFFNVLNKLQLIALIIAAVQVVAAVLLISNTIRVAAYSRRRETGIMRLVGASNLYIQLPFLLEGVLAGLVGAGFASAALVAVKVVLVDGQLRPNFPVIAFVGWDDVLAIVPWLFLTGVLLAGLASFVTLRRHLRV